MLEYVATAPPSYPKCNPPVETIALKLEDLIGNCFGTIGDSPDWPSALNRVYC